MIFPNWNFYCKWFFQNGTFIANDFLDVNLLLQMIFPNWNFLSQMIFPIWNFYCKLFFQMKLLSQIISQYGTFIANDFSNTELLLQMIFSIFKLLLQMIFPNGFRLEKVIRKFYWPKIIKMYLRVKLLILEIIILLFCLHTSRNLIYSILLKNRIN